MVSLAAQRVTSPAGGHRRPETSGWLEVVSVGRGGGAQLAQNVAPGAEAPAQGLSLQAWLHAWHERVALGEAGAQNSCCFQRV